MKVSIIIPIYNTEKFLSECIESVINQTYKNIEIILVNDGSPGTPYEICKKYIEADSRIKYFSQENKGVAVARNFGISKATGDYIFCLDSDDTINLTFVKEICDTLLNCRYDILVLGTYYCNSYVERGTLPTMGFAVKREFLEKYPDVRFQDGIMPCEDGLFTHKMLALTTNIGKCPKAIYNYRYNPISCEHTLDNQKILNDIPKWYDILEDFYNKYNLWDKKLHLLSFINNEPFGLRFCNMPFNNDEKRKIFNVTHKFICKHNLSKINKNKIKNLSKDFYNFVISSSFYEYQIRKYFAELVFTTYLLENHKVVQIFKIKFKFRINCK